MQLTVGERLEGSGPEQQPGGYVVTGVVNETPWSGLYTAKKVFYNFDFTAKRVRETDDKEWLDVFLRTIRYPVLDQADYVSQRRALARAEVRGILGTRHSNLWPEPIDLLELEESRDPFTYVADGQDGRGGEPIVVFARPHGLFLPAWLNQMLPMTSVLSVLAELLEFIRQAHDEGLLLLGLSPDAVVVDTLERVHYVGTDMAIAQHSPLLLEGRTDGWGRFFPPERFPRGFAAPECFHPGGRPDRRSDLYSWGCLVYLLLTGDSPLQIAQRQGRPWALFQEEHFGRLESALKELPAALRGPWVEQLGLPPGMLPAEWVQNVLGALHLLLSPNPSRRPSTVAELRRWLINLPPTAVSSMVALQMDPGAARLLLDCSALAPAGRIRIRRARGRAPSDPDEGDRIYDGPAQGFVIDNDLPLTTDLTPLYYTAWAVKDVNGQPVFSAGVSEVLWQPTAANLQRWAEEQAALGAEGDYPVRVAMVLGALDPSEAAYAMLPSGSARVRGWGLRRLEQGLAGGFRFSLAEPVLWQYLRDPVAVNRLAAALDLWRHVEAQTDDVLVQILEALEAPPLDGNPPTAKFIAQLELSEERIARLLKLLEQRRPTTCPLCTQPIPAKDRIAHLREAHGYIEYEGDAVPYAVAVARLWERVLHRQDTASHDRLLELYLRVTPLGTTEPPGLSRYVADLQKQVSGKTLLALGAAAPVALPYAAFDTYLTMLRASEPFMPIVRLMLLLGDSRLRELARDALLPVLAEKLCRESIGTEEVWQALEEACLGSDMIDERLRLCERLPALGVNAAAVNACVVRLQDERMVRCSECGTHVKSRDLETHLRRVHQVFEFRGVRRTFEETRAALLYAICSTPPDLKAMLNLRSLVEDHYRKDANRHLTAWLFEHIRGLHPDRRPAAVVGLAEALAAGGGAAELLPLLVTPNKSRTSTQIGRRLALELCARLPAPVPDEVIECARPLLGDKDLSRKSRQRAVIALLRTTGRVGPHAKAVLRAAVAGVGKVRAIERLHQLEQRVGQAPAIDELCREIEDEVRMSCPRCPTQLRKKDMVRHLWDRHRLVLDGQRVREPWRVLEDWAVDYGLEKDPDLLKRCQDLAARVDPEGGLTRLHRLMLRRGTQDREVIAALVTEAKAGQTSVCPHCYHFVPCEQPPTPEPLRAHGNVLEGFGYRLELGEQAGLLPTLHIESPNEVLYTGREPGRWLTRLAAIALICAAMLVLFVVLQGITESPVPITRTLGIAVVVGGIGMILIGMVYMLWPTPAPSKVRLVRAAWDQLIPQMVAEPMSRDDWSFLYGLALLSAEPGRQPRMQVLADCYEAAAAGKADHVLAAQCLTELCLLRFRELREARRAAIGFLADELSDALTGKRSLRFLGLVADRLDTLARDWSPAELRRLQILVAARAFEHSLTVDDLTDVARVFPSARTLLGLDDRWRWGQLEVLWTMRRSRAWEEAGTASTVFDFADRADSAEGLLTDSPHILLHVGQESLYISSRGVWVLGQYIAARPDDQEIMWEFSTADRCYVLQIGSHRLRTKTKPRDLVIALKAWLRFYFDTFLPRLPNARRPSSDAAQKMWQTLRTTCPECSRPIVPCVGDLGIALR
jgi:hypothetical protein